MNRDIERINQFEAFVKEDLETYRKFREELLDKMIKVETSCINMETEKVDSSEFKSLFTNISKETKACTIKMTQC